MALTVLCALFCCPSILPCASLYTHSSLGPRVVSTLAVIPNLLPFYHGKSTRRQGGELRRTARIRLRLFAAPLRVARNFLGRGCYMSPSPPPGPALPFTALPFTLKLLLSLRHPRCSGKPLADMVARTDGIGYLAVARTGSEAMQSALASAADVDKHDLPHNHDCRLRDLEHIPGAHRVLISLRHPVDRIMSGTARRVEKHEKSKPANSLFQQHFRGKDAVND